MITITPWRKRLLLDANATYCTSWHLYANWCNKQPCTLLQQVTLHAAAADSFSIIYIYLKAKYESQLRSCSTEHEKKKRCPNKPSEVCAVRSKRRAVVSRLVHVYLFLKEDNNQIIAIFSCDPFLLYTRTLPVLKAAAEPDAVLRRC